MYDTSTIAARLISLHGEAWVWDGDDRLPLAVGSLLDAGQLLETGPHGTLALLLSSGHELGLEPNQSLLLDADVLADTSADISEWTLASTAPSGLLAEWLSPSHARLGPDAVLGFDGVLGLDAVLDGASSSLDSLLGPAPANNTGSMASAVLNNGLADADLAGLLRSLYGTEPGHLG
jgi:hypothetical protein